MGVRSTNPIQSFIDDFYRSGKDAVSPVCCSCGLTATGGIISDYTSGSKYYRAHSFTGSGTFTVSKLGYNTRISCHRRWRWWRMPLGAGGGGAGGLVGISNTSHQLKVVEELLVHQYQHL